MLLLALPAAAEAPPDGPETPAWAAEACRYAAAIPPERIRDFTIRDGVLDVDGDGRFERLTGTSALGTMGGEAWEAADDADRPLQWEDADDVGPDFGQRWLPFRGRAFLLGFVEEAAGYLKRLSYVGSDGRLHAGCSFLTKVESLLVATTPGFEATCDAIESGKAASLEIRSLEADGAGVPNAGRPETAVTGKLAVDFANMGREVDLYRLEISSGAGRGCDISYFETAAAIDKPGSDPYGQLLASLQRIPRGERFLNGECGGLAKRWLLHDGKAYLETRYPGERPDSVSREVHHVDGVVDGAPTRICAAMFTRRWELDSIR
ncbi:hypothetical protein [Methylobacterium hispanicum]|uniref:hypothetical protein n=1 Tax=Methylobacterium hispanicum TaxID=270350 RepID=UPI001EDE69D4|nr:hypothetical protein [Methylobacterium hispanicum]